MYEDALELTLFQKAPQIFVPSKAITASTKQLEASLAAVRNMVHVYVQTPDKCYHQLLCLFRILKELFATRKTSEVLDVYEEIFTNPGLCAGLESILKVIESILTMSLSSVGNERAGRTLTQTLTSERLSWKSDIVDAQLRIGTNECRLHDLDVKIFTKKWLNDGHRAATQKCGTKPSSVLERMKAESLKLNIY